MGVIPMERDQESRRIVILCLLAGIILCGVTLSYFFLLASPAEKEVTVTDLTDTEHHKEGEILVYVVGAIRHPGVYQLPAKSRVFDVVKAAGDVLPYANTDDVNMADVVSDGDKVYIPLNPYQTTASKENLININQASAQELETLPGVGPATAEKIIRYREDNGWFKAKEDIKKVPSIGDSKFQKLSDRITL